MTSDTQRPPERREIRLFPDYGRRYPLWENSTPTWDVGYATGPGTYGLSKELAEDLEAWQFFLGDAPRSGRRMGRGREQANLAA